MLNRASTVRASTMRALNRNARSGGSGFWAIAAKPSTRAAAPEAAAAAALRACVIRGLRGDPVDVGRQSIGDRDSDDFRKFVWMPCTDGRFDAWIQRLTRLDRDRNLAHGFDFASPVIK